MPNAAPGGKGQRGAASGPGKGKGGAGGGPLPSDWACHLCGCRDNRDWRKRCRKCEALRNDELEYQISQSRPSLAERQVQQQQRSLSQQQQQRRKDEAERRNLREEVAKLRELVAAKAQPPPRADGGDVDEGGADDLDDAAPFAAWSEDERAKRLELARGGLNYAVACHGAESAEAAKCRDEITALQRASREAKPFKAHRAQLERRRERLRGQQERDEETITRTQSEIKELQGKVDALQAAVADRAKTIAEVSEELTELVRKSLAEEEAEGSGSPPPWAQEHSPWGAMAATIRSLAGQPGMPAELTALLTHVQQVAAAMATSAAATQPPQAAAAGGNAATNATGAPVVPAPHARWGKAAPAGGSSPATPKPTPPGAADVGGTTSGGDGGGAATSAAAAPAAPAAAAAAATAGTTASSAAAAAPGSNDGSEPELLEVKTSDDDPMAVDIESSLALLPERDQRKLRAAIRLGGGRGRGRAEDDAEDSRREERERSPRPTKAGDSEL